MKQKNARLLRGLGAAILGVLILAAVLPSIGGVIEGPARPGMWRCGPFLYYPGSFFMVTGAVIVSTGCTLFGIVRGNAIEITGWILLGVLFLFILIG
jgi:hypothetical protein